MPVFHRVGRTSKRSVLETALRPSMSAAASPELYGSSLRTLEVTYYFVCADEHVGELRSGSRGLAQSPAGTRNSIGT